MSLAGKRIMVVDDEPDIVAVIKMTLERWGARVTTFTKPLQALEAFRKEPSAYDLLITDIRMPRMNGVQLAREVLAIRPDVKTMYVSAFEVDHRMYEAIEAGEIEENLLKKPVTQLKLCEAVKSLGPSAEIIIENVSGHDKPDSFCHGALV
jgi:CheY-like chemotaxis protein